MTYFVLSEIEKQIKCRENRHDLRMYTTFDISSQCKISSFYFNSDVYSFYVLYVTFSRNSKIRTRPVLDPAIYSDLYRKHVLRSCVS